MKELTMNEVQEVNGGIVPLMYFGYQVAQYAVIRYGARQLAGYAVGAATAWFAE